MEAVKGSRAKWGEIGGTHLCRLGWEIYYESIEMRDFSIPFIQKQLVISGN